MNNLTLLLSEIYYHAIDLQERFAYIRKCHYLSIVRSHSATVPCNNVGGLAFQEAVGMKL